MSAWWDFFRSSPLTCTGLMLLLGGGIALWVWRVHRQSD